MDLQALYDLKERLEYAAIAGTGLLPEDFRLKRAVEALAPLAAASPVFAKLSASAQALLTAPAEERGKTLLDVLSLVNAVAYTQGAVNVPGELKPLEPASGSYVQAPYSLLQPLLAALQETGSGRMAKIQACWETHPEYFRDFRVLPHVVNALGDPYGELSELICDILRSQGMSVIPFLKDGFDGKGKREMVRRVQLIETIAGAQENRFYLSALEGAEKEVRCALIYALRHEEANAQKLAELCQTERGSGKKAAHWTLAKLSSASAWAYWDSLAEKDLKQAVSYMPRSPARQAGDLAAKALNRWLTVYEETSPAEITKEDADYLQTLLFALLGKTGAAVCGAYRRMAALGTSLDSVGCQADGKTTPLRLRAAEDRLETFPFSQAIAMILRRSILFNPAPELIALAGELSRRQAAYQITEATAALLSGTAAEALEAAEPWLKTSGLILKKRPRESADALRLVLQDIRWSESVGKPVFCLSFSDPAAGKLSITCPIREPLDRRWYQYLASPGGNEDTDAFLFLFLDPQNAALRQQLGQYFYKRALVVNDNRSYLPWLKKCRWTNCRGLMEAYCMHNKASSWMLINYLEAMPGCPEDRAAEAERVLGLVRNKQIQVGSWYPDQIERRIAALRGQL